MARCLLLFLLACGAGCTQFPQLDALEGDDVRDADFPRLLPLEQITEARPASIDRSVEVDVLSRVSALQARADRLKKGAVVDRATRRRMDAGVSAAQ